MHEKTARSLPSAKAVPACWAFKAQFRGFTPGEITFAVTNDADERLWRAGNGKTRQRESDSEKRSIIIAGFTGKGRTYGIKFDTMSEGEGENHRRQPRYADSLKAKGSCIFVLRTQ
jgi:hypothetical protein